MKEPICWLKPMDQVRQYMKYWLIFPYFAFIAGYVSLPGHPGHSDSDEAFLERPINPTIGRSRFITGVRHTLPVEQRRHSNAIIIHNRWHSSCCQSNVQYEYCSDEDIDVVFTSYGPIIIEDVSAAAGARDARTPGCCSRAVGWVLATLSTLLFTSTIFCAKFWAINPVQLLLVRSLLQTVLTALILSK